MNKFILLLNLTLLLSGVYLHSNLHFVTAREMQFACQSGVLAYVTRYPEDLPVLEKRKRIRYIGERCRVMAKTYLELQ